MLYTVCCILYAAYTLCLALVLKCVIFIRSKSVQMIYFSSVIFFSSKSFLISRKFIGETKFLWCGYQSGEVLQIVEFKFWHWILASSKVIFVSISFRLPLKSLYLHISGWSNYECKLFYKWVQIWVQTS